MPPTDVWGTRGRTVLEMNSDNQADCAQRPRAQVTQPSTSERDRPTTHSCSTFDAAHPVTTGVLVISMHGIVRKFFPGHSKLYIGYQINYESRATVEVWKGEAISDPNKTLSPPC